MNRYRENLQIGFGLLFMWIYLFNGNSENKIKLCAKNSIKFDQMIDSK